MLAFSLLNHKSVSVSEDGTENISPFDTDAMLVYLYHFVVLFSTPPKTTPMKKLFLFIISAYIIENFAATQHPSISNESRTGK